ncbi:MAG: putative transcriptional regulator [Devosia sp.]|uniref:ATP-binding protein n=1 Tax=Devosia sp. TaxID=1871048 RepID=UPI00262D230A|nr:ATP-binding protein [Devosia sp.]MDB5542792.1 putative transcriptional regulator [Devosia sp.]
MPIQTSAPSSSRRGFAFEEGVAATHLSAAAILEDFACRELGALLYEGEPSDETLLTYFANEGLIHDDKQGGFDITNLFALSAARDLTRYKTISDKAPRVIAYKTNTKLTGLEDTTGRLGYAVAFQKILAYVMRAAGGQEVLQHGVRRFEPAYPEKAVREFLANAMIHQDLVASGGRPLVEVFSDKIQFTNPGEPLVDIERLIDAPARSRNERLAGLMRKARLCEERGSGIDRALWSIEEAKLAPPSFAVVEGSMVVTMFKGTNFAAMSKEDRIRACYQHATLHHLKNAPMSNSSLRDRLGLNKNQYPQVSNVISDTIAAGLIRPLDVDQGNRLARYVPYWA